MCNGQVATNLFLLFTCGLEHVTFVLPVLFLSNRMGAFYIKFGEVSLQWDKKVKPRPDKVKVKVKLLHDRESELRTGEISGSKRDGFKWNLESKQKVISWTGLELDYRSIRQLDLVIECNFYSSKDVVIREFQVAFPLIAVEKEFYCQHRFAMEDEGRKCSAMATFHLTDEPDTLPFQGYVGLFTPAYVDMKQGGPLMVAPKVVRTAAANALTAIDRQYIGLLSELDFIRNAVQLWATGTVEGQVDALATLTREVQEPYHCNLLGEI